MGIDISSRPMRYGQTPEERWGALDDATHELNQKLGKTALMTGAQLALRHTFPAPTASRPVSDCQTWALVKKILH